MSSRQLSAVTAAYATFGHYDDDDDLFDGIASAARRWAKWQILSCMFVCVCMFAACNVNIIPRVLPGRTQNFRDVQGLHVAGTTLDIGPIAALPPSYAWCLHVGGGCCKRCP